MIEQDSMRAPSRMNKTTWGLKVDRTRQHEGSKLIGHDNMTAQNALNLLKSLNSIH